MSCPCGLPPAYDACCGRLHEGTPAPTAQALMRARYSAFVVGDAAYLLRSWHSTTRPARLHLDDPQSWERLEVLATSRGGLLDAEGTVEFRAHYALDGRPGSLHEVSRFVREDAAWVYVGPQ